MKIDFIVLLYSSIAYIEFDSKSRKLAWLKKMKKLIFSAMFCKKYLFSVETTDQQKTVAETENSHSET